MNIPFILNFVDYFKPEESVNKYTEYSLSLNLNVLKGTAIPATCALDLEGETFTKANFEDTDCFNQARSNLLSLLTGETVTESTEATDRCKRGFSKLVSLLGGETITLVSREPTDRSIKSSILDVMNILEGETNTRSHQESTDHK